MHISGRKIKLARKLYNSVLGECCYLRPLLSVLYNDSDSPYPSNFLLNIARKDEKELGKNVRECFDLISKNTPS